LRLLLRVVPLERRDGRDPVRPETPEADPDPRPLETPEAVLVATAAPAGSRPQRLQKPLSMTPSQLGCWHLSPSIRVSVSKVSQFLKV
jgi:hypothetical protein